MQRSACRWLRVSAKKTRAARFELDCRFRTGGDWGAVLLPLMSTAKITAFLSSLNIFQTRTCMFFTTSYLDWFVDTGSSRIRTYLGLRWYSLNGNKKKPNFVGLHLQFKAVNQSWVLFIFLYWMDLSPYVAYWWLTCLVNTQIPLDWFNAATLWCLF